MSRESCFLEKEKGEEEPKSGSKVRMGIGKWVIVYSKQADWTALFAT